MSEDRKFWKLFFIMFKIGAITFGGGYVMVPLFEDEFVQKRGWITETDMCNMVALSQSVPGAIAINCSILIGYRLYKLRGAITAVLGTILPSVIALTAVTYLYEAVRDNVYVAGALRGIRAAVVALLVSAFWRFSKPFRKDIVALAAFITAFALSLILGVSSIYIILGGIAFGILVGIWRLPPGQSRSCPLPKEDAGKDGDA